MIISDASKQICEHDTRIWKVVNHYIKEARSREGFSDVTVIGIDESSCVKGHNNDAERAIRQGVVHRKINGGRRTWKGAEVFEVILSVYETSKKRGQRFMGMVKKGL